MISSDHFDRERSPYAQRLNDISLDGWWEDQDSERESSQPAPMHRPSGPRAVAEDPVAMTDARGQSRVNAGFPGPRSSGQPAEAIPSSSASAGEPANPDNERTA